MWAETLGGVFAPLLKTGCATPCKDSEIFSTAQDNQGRFQINLFRDSLWVTSIGLFYFCRLRGPFSPEIARYVLEEL
jgi:molecular chaperone DnaK (HSP70)